MANEEQNPPVEDVVDGAPETSGGEDSAAETGVAVNLEEEVKSLQAELQTAHEQVLRAQAEVQNIRRRAEQDVEKAHKFALEKFVNDVLPVADNLERAITSMADMDVDQEGTKAVLEGVELTHKTLLDALKRHQVEEVDPAGAPFDPQLHQAMSMVESADAEPNTVLNVFQKGYTLNGRLVRPAMVVVSKAPA